MTARPDAIEDRIAERVADILEQRGFKEPRIVVKKGLYTPDDAAEYLSMSKAAVLKLVRDGELAKHPKLPDRVIRIHIDVLRRFAEAGG